jgi:hypothetical protein
VSCRKSSKCVRYALAESETFFICLVELLTSAPIDLRRAGSTFRESSPSLPYDVHQLLISNHPGQYNFTIVSCMGVVKNKKF